MFDNIKQQLLQYIYLKNFFCVFTLRQGTILIAISQIALSSLFLIILLTGLSHADIMMNMLHTDMEDDTETRASYVKILRVKENSIIHGPDHIRCLNGQMFTKAEHLASQIVLWLSTTTFIVALYLTSSMSLLYGAVKYKRTYMMPWIACTLTALLLYIIGALTSVFFEDFINLFGGHKVYYLCGAAFFLFNMYFILTVHSFVAQVVQLRPDKCRFAVNDRIITSKPRPTRHPNIELGERMVLIDHAAQSSLLSSTQLTKLSHGMQSQFV